MYRSADAELSQGDIIDGIPHVRLRPPLTVVRSVTIRGARDVYAPFPYPPVEGKTPDAKREGKSIMLAAFHPKAGEYLAAFSQFTRAIVLNYDCDLANDEGHCLVAVVRPITAVHEEDRQTIRDNKNFTHFYLPWDESHNIEEGYADLRQITSVDPALLEAVGTRLVSLSELGVNALQTQIFRFLTRRDLLATPPA
jgi:hypothetical protein